MQNLYLVTPNRKIITRLQLRNVPWFCPFKGMDALHD
ncbi:hypothetical protein CYFUS_005367 [Cystobacter fuscus]|uniref:Uncharacterized protein n=1 Tax=Cystobacter fuscus TaxID=43 RepID=A0A250J7M3_9BACT|nr:hypothetical protein CYFUS_005367 [Cystobacter fuscus]